MRLIDNCRVPPLGLGILEICAVVPAPPVRGKGTVNYVKCEGPSFLF